MAERSILDELQELSKKGLLSKRVVILKGPLQNGSPVVEKSEETIIDDEGMKEVTVSELSYAPACHHLIHTEEELGAVCVVCGQVMCRACSVNNVCSACGRTVCKQDQKSIEDVGMVCGLCKNEWLRKKAISLFLTMAGLGILVYLVLRFIQ
jgi:hypothetical protein